MNQKDRRRWEYETLRVPRGPTKKESEDPRTQLNEYAADGWRLVESVDYVGGGTKYLVLERPVDADEETGSDTRSRE
ncbi:DUF4177 domain-containing protein [Haloprofundus halobius]|uniref:DUF4177 domain-containing protein n=1 Tax=Haloprofundus halobius TaxID=2876194 RepID=UPI001CCB488B|nr:DUF4177 domain-containing protein [Haloprofundus halobius]